MAQQPGETLIRHKESGEIWAIPTGESYDLNKWEIAVQPGPADQPVVYGPGRMDRREGFGGPGPVLDPLSPEFNERYGLGPIPRGHVGSEPGPGPLEMLTAGGRTVTQGILPTVGSIVGRAAPLPGAPYTGEAIGGFAGEAANQLFGITEPSATGLAVQTLAPFGGRMLGFGTPGAARAASSTVVRHEAGARTLEALPGKFAPGTPSAVLAQTVQQYNPRIPTGNLLKAADDIIAKEMALPEGARNETALRIARGLAEELRTGTQTQGPQNIGQGGKRLPFQEFRDWLQRYGEMTGEAKRKGETITSETSSKIYRAAQADLDDALGRMQVRVGPGGTVTVGASQSSQAAQALRDFNAAFRKEKAAEELGQMMLDKGVIVTRDDGLRHIHPRKFFDAFRKDEFLAQSFTKQEQDAIKATVKKLEGIPILPAQAGQNFGSGRLIGSAAISGGIASTLGLDPWQAAGLVAGVPWILSRAMANQKGRELLIQLSTKSGSLDHNALATLAAFTASQTRE